MVHSSMQKRVQFQEIIHALLDDNTPFPPSYIHYFSDLDENNLAQLKSIWLKINIERRVSLLQDIKDLSEADTTTSFENLSEITLFDPEARVRIAGLKVLWDTENFHLIPTLIDLLEKDPDDLVRASAAEVLGEFVYLGELDKIPKNYHHAIEEALISVFNHSDAPSLRQKIVEALGYSSRDEVTPLILTAYQQKDPSWLSSALFAMGRSADKKWEQMVIQSLHHPDQRVQLEAVRASGELELEATRETIIEILKQTQPDDELSSVAIWSLSQIGGDEVREILEEMLDQTTDDDELDFLEEAIENLNFTQGVQQFRIFNVKKPQKDDWMKEITLEDEIEENTDFTIEDDEDERR